MKLLKSAGCLLPADGGNVKEQTMIVEEQGIGFRTGVRFPSAPLKNPSAIDFKTNSGWIFYFQDRYSCFFVLRSQKDTD